jgi:uncharacterized protein (TIGR00290 family)
MKTKVFFNWSGGKDSALALYKLKQNPHFEIECLLTTLSEKYNRISMHGVRSELLEAQAESMGLALEKVFLPESSGMDEYERILGIKMNELKSRHLTHAAFGDIFLEDLKEFRINQLAKAGMQTLFPLWKVDTKELIREFLDLGFKTMVVCVNEKYLDKSFAGRIIDEQFIRDLPGSVDVCGENGEYHSFVFDGPVFTKPVKFRKGELEHRIYENSADPHLQSGFWFCDLIPE